LGDGDPVGELLSRLAQPFSSYCSKSVGPGFKGILTSDRYSAYNWLAVSHLGASQARFHPNCRTSGASAVGRALLEQEKHLFALWYQVRDGTLSRRDLSGAVAPIRSRVHELLIAATNEIGTREKTPGKTVRTCRQLLQSQHCGYL